MPTITTGLNIFVFFLGHGSTTVAPSGDDRRDQSAAARLLDAINLI